MTFAASRLSVVQPSASMTVSGRAKELKAAGHDVVDLGLGEPDFDTPAHIVEAAHAAALAGKTRYPPTGGTADLREAVVAKFQRENGLAFASDEIIVSNGAKQVIFDALMATLEPGQEVLLCAPHFDTYKTMTSVIGGVPLSKMADHLVSSDIAEDLASLYWDKRKVESVCLRILSGARLTRQQRAIQLSTASPTMIAHRSTT